MQSSGLALLLGALVLIKGTQTGRVDPQMCRSAPRMVLHGKDVLEPHKGNVLLIILMQLHCEYCRAQMSALKALAHQFDAQHMQDTSIVVVAPGNQSAEWIAFWQREKDEPDHSHMQIVRDTDAAAIWTQLNGQQNDAYVYDRCQRLSYFIPSPQSNLTSYHYVTQSLHNAHNYQPCGVCQYDRHRHAASPTMPVSGHSHEYAVPRTATSLLNVHVARPNAAATRTNQRSSTASERYEQRPATTTPVPARTTPWVPWWDKTTVPNTTPYTRQQWPRPSSAIAQPQRYQDQRQQQPYYYSTETPVRYRPQQQAPTPNYYRTTTQPSYYYQTTTRRPYNYQTTTTRPYNYQTTTRRPYNYQTTTTRPYNYHTTTPNPYRRQQYTTPYNPKPMQQYTTTPNYQTHKVVQPANIPWAARRDDARDPPTARETQLPDDNKWAPEEPVYTTTTPSTTPDQGTRRTKAWPPTPRPSYIHGEDCSLYTDARCLKEQTKKGRENLPPCCYKGLYLTDVCVKGKCSSETYPLCCMQKFIQARYLCCQNETLNGAKGDEFSECCFKNLVWLDFDSACCPAHKAATYWSDKSSLYELCLPSVDIDYSSIHMKSTMADGSQAELPMAKLKHLWQYECSYLQRRPKHHYYYQSNKTADQLMDIILDAGY